MREKIGQAIPESREQSYDMSTYQVCRHCSQADCTQEPTTHNPLVNDFKCVNIFLDRLVLHTTGEKHDSKRSCAVRRVGHSVKRSNANWFLIATSGEKKKNGWTL